MRGCVAWLAIGAILEAMVFGVRLPPGWVRPRRGAAVVFLCVAVLAGCGRASGSGMPLPTTPVAATGPATATTPVDSPSPGAPVTPTAEPATPIRKIVGLGDSVMAGMACDCVGPLDELAARLEQRPGAQQITPVNLGADGATTTDVEKQLNSADGRSAVQGADVVVVIVGANDLNDAYDAWSDAPDDPEPLDDSLAALEVSLPKLLAQLKAVHGPKPATYLVAGYWNVFAEATEADAPDGYEEWSRTATDRANVIISRSAGAAGMTYVDLVAPFRGPTGEDDPTPLLAPDEDHPNAAGVEVLAQALAAKIP